MIINIKNKKDLITLDLRIKQLRYLKESKQIEFLTLSNEDTTGYEYLFNHDKKQFLETLKRELADNGIFIKIKDLKVLK